MQCICAPNVFCARFADAIFDSFRIGRGQRTTKLLYMGVMQMRCLFSLLLIVSVDRSDVDCFRVYVPPMNFLYDGLVCATP